jgi:hypothetical protein
MEEGVQPSADLNVAAATDRFSCDERDSTSAVIVDFFIFSREATTLQR